MAGRPMRIAWLAIALFAFSGTTLAADDYPHGLLPATVTPTRYALELVIDPRRDGFAGKATIEATLNEATRRVWLHGLDLTAVKVTAESGSRRLRATWTQVDPVTGVARLDFGQELAPGPVTLRLSYRGTYRRGSEGLFLIETGGERYVFSQLQAIDARRVFPGFDQPGFKTPFDVTIVAPRGDVAISNAPLLSSKPAGRGRVAHRFATTLPLPTYLLAFAVGPLDVVEAPAIPASDIRDRPLPLRGAATRGNGPKLAFALANTRDMVERLERYFGTPFPYPKLDLIATPSLGGAMENAGAIVYDEYVLLVGEDATPAQLRAFGVVHAHELAHQWFGDLVTPWWWEDTWLNESFADWMGKKIAAEWRPSLFEPTDLVSSTFDTMDFDSRAAGRPIREPVTDNLRISATFDSLTYSKGGGVLAMFESFLGAERFRQGVRLHLARHPHGVATSDEFFAAMADASGQPAVVDAFRGFVVQPGVPLVAVELSGDGASVGLSQSRYRPIGVSFEGETSWQVPLCLSTYGAEGRTKRCSLLAGPATQLALPAPVDAVMPNADGAGYYRFALDPLALRRLLDRADVIPDTEALALVDSVGAAFHAGRLPFADLVAAARRLAGHRNRAVALELGGQLGDIQRRWAGASGHAALAALIAEIYAPRLAELGLDPRAGAYAGQDTDRRLLRASLARRLALEAGHAPTIAILADAARRSLADPAALDPEYRPVAWSVGVREFGPPFAERMAERMLGSADPTVRMAAAEALGAATRPDTAAIGLELLLGPDVRAVEMYMIAGRQVGQPETRQATWAWLQANFERFRDRLPGFSQDYASMMPASFCDAGLRDSAAEFLDQALAAGRTSALTVARTMEGIDVCIAQKTALMASVRAGLGLPME